MYDILADFDFVKLSRYYIPVTCLSLGILRRFVFVLCFFRRMFIPRHCMPVLFPLCIFRTSLREPRHLFSCLFLFFFEYHHPYKNRKHPVNDLLLAPFI